MLAWPAISAAQGVDGLLREGRFDEIVAMAAGVSPDGADELAGLIYDQAYEAGYEAGDFEYAIRGFSAAKRLPNLTMDRRQELDYLHALSLYRLAEERVQPGTLESAESALPLFLEARELVNMLDRNRFDVFELDDALEEYVFVARAIIGRG